MEKLKNSLSTYFRTVILVSHIAKVLLYIINGTWLSFSKYSLIF